MLGAPLAGIGQALRQGEDDYLRTLIHDRRDVTAQVGIGGQGTYELPKRFRRRGSGCTQCGFPFGQGRGKPARRYMTTLLVKIGFMRS